MLRLGSCAKSVPRKLKPFLKDIKIKAIEFASF